MSEPTYWNGEPTPCTKVRVIVGKSPVPTWWCAALAGTEREAVLVVNNPGKKKATIELSYLVNSASWLPQYNLRARPDESKVAVEYND